MKNSTFWLIIILILFCCQFIIPRKPIIYWQDPHIKTIVKIKITDDYGIMLVKNEHLNTIDTGIYYTTKF